LEGHVVEILNNARPVYIRDSEGLTVRFQLSDSPDPIWTAIFESHKDASAHASAADYDLGTAEDGGPFASLHVPWDASAERAQTGVQSLGAFVAAVDSEYAKRTEAMARLEQAVGKLFQPPEALTNESLS
jgi:hypothetical protein